MEDFGTLTIYLNTYVPGMGKRLNYKRVALQRYHGRIGECKQQAAEWLVTNAGLRDSLGMVWEVKAAVHLDELPPPSQD